PFGAAYRGRRPGRLNRFDGPPGPRRLGPGWHLERGLGRRVAMGSGRGPGWPDGPCAGRLLGGGPVAGGGRGGGGAAAGRRSRGGGEGPAPAGVVVPLGGLARDRRRAGRRHPDLIRTGRAGTGVLVLLALLATAGDPLAQGPPHPLDVDRRRHGLAADR